MDKRKARRRYIRKIESTVLANPKMFHVCAERMKEHGWYSPKTSTVDIVFSIFTHLEKLAKGRGREYHLAFRHEILTTQWLGELHKKNHRRSQGNQNETCIN